MARWQTIDADRWLTEDGRYEDAPFCFDLHLNSNFPTEPPLAHFHSWTRGHGRVSPNLYEEGKVCLSLLNSECALSLPMTDLLTPHYSQHGKASRQSHGIPEGAVCFRFSSRCRALFWSWSPTLPNLATRS